jgi:hypothetical protein
VTGHGFQFNLFELNPERLLVSGFVNEQDYITLEVRRPEQEHFPLPRRHRRIHHHRLLAVVPASSFLLEPAKAKEDYMWSVSVVDTDSISLLNGVRSHEPNGSVDNSRM